MENNKLIIENDNILYLTQTNMKMCVCPFAPAPVVPMQKKQGLSLQSNAIQVEYIVQYQPCSSNCPHFNYTKEKKQVSLTCGFGTLIDVTEFKEPELKVDL
jgi:hypothetical protein